MLTKNVLSKKAISFYVLACIFFGLAIAFIFGWSRDVFGFNLDKIVTGLVLLIGGCFLLVPPFMKKKDGFKWLIFGELLVIAAVSIIGFILPEFMTELEQNVGSASMWIGIVLMIHALVHLFMDRFSDKNMKHWLFSFYLFLLAIGAFIIDSKSINVDLIIKIVVISLFTVLAVCFVYLAFKEPKVQKEVKEKEPKKEDKHE